MKQAKNESRLPLMHKGSNSLFSLQNNLLEMWTENGVDQYYQNTVLAFLDQLQQDEAIEEIVKEQKRMLENKSQYNIIRQSLSSREQIITSIYNKLNDQSQVQTLSDQLDDLRKSNLILCESILQMKECLEKKGINMDHICNGYCKLFSKLDKDNQKIKKSFLSNYISFGKGFDPFFLTPYENLQQKGFPSETPKCIKKLFKMNISYVYRLIKAKNELLSCMSCPCISRKQEGAFGQSPNIPFLPNKQKLQKIDEQEQFEKSKSSSRQPSELKKNEQQKQFKNLNLRNNGRILKKSQQRLNKKIVSKSLGIQAVSSSPHQKNKSAIFPTIQNKKSLSVVSHQTIKKKSPNFNQRINKTIQIPSLRSQTGTDDLSSQDQVDQYRRNMFRKNLKNRNSGPTKKKLYHQKLNPIPQNPNKRKFSTFQTNKKNQTQTSPRPLDRKKYSDSPSGISPSKRGQKRNYINVSPKQQNTNQKGLNQDRTPYMRPIKYPQNQEQQKQQFRPIVFRRKNRRNGSGEISSRLQNGSDHNTSLYNESMTTKKQTSTPRYDNHNNNREQDQMGDQNWTKNQYPSQRKNPKQDSMLYEENKFDRRERQLKQKERQLKLLAKQKELQQLERQLKQDKQKRGDKRHREDIDMGRDGQIWEYKDNGNRYGQRYNKQSDNIQQSAQIEQSKYSPLSRNNGIKNTINAQKTKQQPAKKPQKAYQPSRFDNEVKKQYPQLYPKQQQQPQLYRKSQQQQAGSPKKYNQLDKQKYDQPHKTQNSNPRERYGGQKYEAGQKYDPKNNDEGQKEKQNTQKYNHREKQGYNEKNHNGTARQRQNEQKYDRQKYGGRERQEYYEKGVQKYDGKGAQKYGERQRQKYKEQKYGERERQKQDEQKYGERERQKYNGKNNSGQKYGGREQQKYDGRGAQKYGGRQRQKYDGRGAQKYGGRQRQKYDGREAQKYSGRQNQKYIPQSYEGKRGQKYNTQNYDKREEQKYNGQNYDGSRAQNYSNKNYDGQKKQKYNGQNYDGKERYYDERKQQRNNRINQQLNTGQARKEGNKKNERQSPQRYSEQKQYNNQQQAYENQDKNAYDDDRQAFKGRETKIKNDKQSALNKQKNMTQNSMDNSRNQFLSSVQDKRQLNMRKKDDQAGPNFSNKTENQRQGTKSALKNKKYCQNDQKSYHKSQKQKQIPPMMLKEGNEKDNNHKEGDSQKYNKEGPANQNRNATENLHQSSSNMGDYDQNGKSSQKYNGQKYPNPHRAKFVDDPSNVSEKYSNQINSNGNNTDNVQRTQKIGEKSKIQDLNNNNPNKTQNTNQKNENQEKKEERSMDKSEKKMQNSSIRNQGLSQQMTSRSSISENKKFVKMKPSDITLKEFFQFINKQKVSTESRKQFQVGDWKHRIQNSLCYFTLFLVNEDLASFGICTPINNGDYEILYWGIIEDICSPKLKVALVNRYLEYLEKFTSLQKIYTISSKFIDLGFNKQNNMYSRRRCSVIKKERQIAPFFSAQCSNICFEQKDKNVSYLYSEQIDHFDPSKVMVSNNLGFCLQQNQKRVGSVFKFYQNIEEIENINKILEKQQIDSYEISSDMKFGKCKMAAVNYNFLPKNSFFFNQAYFVSFGNIYEAQKIRVFQMELQIQDYHLFFSNKNCKIEEFSSFCSKSATKNPQKKANFAFKLFSKQLYGRLKNDEFLSAGCYGNWDITFAWSNQLKGVIKNPLPASQYILAPDNFFVALSYKDEILYSFQVTSNDLIF